MRLNLSENLKQLRKNKNLTQEDVASELGVSFQAVSRWENGLSYPDIELLPRISALFDVSMDTLFDMDSNSEELKMEKYCEESEKLESIEEKISLTKEYIEKMPTNVYLKERLLLLYTACGLEFTKNKIAEMRKLCQYVVDHTTEDSWMRYNALYKMISVEDEENLEIWLSQLDRQSRITSKEALLNRYFYRNEVEKYNKSIQDDIYSTLRDIFLRDFCKRDEKHYKNAESRMIGQQAILKIMDTLRDPDKEIDAWIEERIFAYLRLAGGCFGCGRNDEGYKALEKCVTLCEEYSKLSEGTALSFNSPILDMISQPVDAKYFIKEVIYPSLVNVSGWEWFNGVREEEKYKELVCRVEAMIQ